VIGGHRLDGGGHEQALSSMPSVGKQHAREREIVVSSRDQPSITLLERGWPAPLTGRRLVGDDERAVLAAVGVREPIDLGGRHEEGRVFHLQRTKDPFLEEA
jgi:hypothetical protein